MNPSVFYKYQNIHLEEINNDAVLKSNNSGLGVDLQLRPIKNLTLYAGYSFLNQYEEENTKSFEFGGKYLSENLKIDLRYFEREDFVPFNISYPWWAGYELGSLPQNGNGIAFMIGYKFWFLLLEGTASHYFNLSESLKQIPESQYSGGIFVNNVFFDNHLDLKTGFVFYYNGKSFHRFQSTEVDPSNKLDFTLAGEIGSVAIVYFIWENLFDEQYYITPYYPIPGRNIRFGLSWEIFN
jgi:hypothetical protein